MRRALCALVVLLHVGTLIVDAQKPTVVTNPVSTGMKERATQNLPDHTKPNIAAALRCNSCLAVSSEVYEGLFNLRELRDGKPSDLEQLEALQDVCAMMKDQYGLTVSESGEVSLKFDHSSKAPYQAKGVWVSSMIAQRCADITDDYEDVILASVAASHKKLLKNAPGNKLRNVNPDDARKDQVAFHKKVCIKLDKACPASVFPEPKEDEL